MPERAPKTPTWPLTRIVAHITVPLAFSEVAEKWSDTGKGPRKKPVVERLEKALEDALPDVQDEFEKEMAERQAEERARQLADVPDEDLLCAVKSRGLLESKE